MSQKKQQELKSKIERLRHKLQVAEFQLVRLQTYRLTQGEYKDCKICKQSLLDDVGQTCSWRHCCGGLCVACAQHAVCAKCSEFVCANDCRDDDEGRTCCYHCTA